MFELMLVKKKGASIGLNFGIYAGSNTVAYNTTDKYNYLNDAVNPSTNLGRITTSLLGVVISQSAR